MTVALRTPARPGPARRPTRPAPEHLRVVDPQRRTRRAARARLRLLVVGVCLVVVGSLFGVVAFHALLVSGQTSLDRLNRAVAEEEARYQQLRLEVAGLESPGRIMAAAQERLGMVPPPEVTYLSPSGAVAGELAMSGPDVAGADDNEASETGSGSLRPWATVKPYLGGRR